MPAATPSDPKTPPPARPPRQPVAPPDTHDPADTPRPRPIDDPHSPNPGETMLSPLDAEIARLMRLVVQSD
jgi:hypothetical protein